MVINFKGTNQFYLLGVIFLLPIFLTAQPYRYVKNEKIEIKKEASVSNKINTYYDSDRIYYLFQKSEKLRSLFYYNIIKSTTDSIELTYTKKYKEALNNDVRDLVILKDHLVVLTDDFVLTFKLIKDKYVCLNSIKNTYFFERLFRLDDENCFLYVDYPFHPLDSKYKHVWAKFNHLKNEITEVRFPPEINSKFGNLVNNWVDVKNERILHASTLQYKLNIYDKNYRLVDSIATNYLDSNKMYIEKSSGININGKEDILALKKIDEKYLSRIQKVYYINENKIIVIVKLKGRTTRRCDLWQKNINWSHISSFEIDDWYMSGKKYSADNHPPFELLFTSTGIVSLGENKMAFLYSPFLEMKEVEKFDEQKDYNEPVNKREIKNENSIGIKVLAFD